MGQYNINLTEEEKKSILDKHKEIYDGFVTQSGKLNNEQPLYVQDFANDKEGITISNSGVIKPYTNININESALDMIGDGETDLENGTTDLTDEYDDLLDYISTHRDANEIDDEDWGSPFDDFETEQYLEDEIEDFELRESVKNQIKESISKFKTFKKYL